MKAWFRSQLCTRLSEVWSKLNAKLRGHYQYYGVTDNWDALMVFREEVRRFAKRWLNRRSQKTHVNWHQFATYCERHPLASPQRLTDLIAMSRGN